MAKIITLTQGYSTIISDGDFERVKNYSWHAAKVGKTTVYAKSWKNGKTVYMHHLIADHKLNAIQTTIDHKNLWYGDQVDKIIDNRQCNLRAASQQQQQFNSSMRGNKLGVKGVYAVRNKFKAQITHNYKDIYLGLHDTIDEAALAYNRAAKKLFGKFAKLNV